MLYLSDNLAYIPYSVLDEPLYVIHHIDIQISVSGTNLLQSFKEVLWLFMTFYNFEFQVGIKSFHQLSENWRK